MKSDLNKGIINITYNDLNLPSQISYTGNNRIVYSYDAAGNKRKQEVYDEFHGKKPTTTTFIGNFVYQNGVLMWHNFDEGRVVYNKGLSVSRTEIFLKDHLGNVRVVYDNSTGEPVQHTNYYPFGMQMYTPPSLSSSSNPNKYLYNGKMYQDELGLGWYDYGARFYDGVVGRWWSVDPLAEVSRRWSPYNYCVDNPMRFVDPDGMMVGDPLRDMAIRANRASNLFGTVRTKNNIANSKNHQGFDYHADIGTEAVAVSEAVVYSIDCSDDSDYGINVTLEYTNEEGNCEYAFYAHMDDINVSEGQQVNEGEMIGTTGATGNADVNDAHLHFEVRSVPSPGRGLNGRINPNAITDTDFISQNPKLTQQQTGVTKIEKNKAGIIATNQSIDGSNKIIREDSVINKMQPKSYGK